jgi:hypothetical protein
VALVRERGSQRGGAGTASTRRTDAAGAVPAPGVAIDGRTGLAAGNHQRGGDKSVAETKRFFL